MKACAAASPRTLTSTRASATPLTISSAALTATTASGLFPRARAGALLTAPAAAPPRTSERSLGALSAPHLTLDSATTPAVSAAGPGKPQTPRALMVPLLTADAETGGREHHTYNL